MMRAGLLGLVCTSMICVPLSAGADELPEEAATLVAAFEEDVEALEFEANRRIELLGKEAAEALKPIQDEYTRAAKLDEAVAIRDKRLALTGGRADPDVAEPDVAELPEEARQVVAELERDCEEVLRKAAGAIREQKREVATRLQLLQDAFTREAKLDEAVAIRDTIRALKQGFSSAAPDPGSVSGLTSEIGQSHVFKVTGATSGSVWGTHIFTADSRIAMAAVHAGVLKDGQTGLVKVTVLPGRASYAGSTANGVTTHAYGGYSLSYRVDKVFGGFLEPDESAEPGAAPGESGTDPGEDTPRRGSPPPR